MDYYFSPVYGTRIRPDARLLFGDDSLPRGEWVLDSNARAERTLEEGIDFIICMSFIAVKGIARRRNHDFLEFVLLQYDRLQELSAVPLEPIPRLANDFDTVTALLDGLSKHSTKSQKAAIARVRSYVREIHDLVSGSV